MSAGILDLARALRTLQTEFRLNMAAGAVLLPDGHTITMRWSGDVLELEREDGEVALLDATAVMGGDQ